MKHDKKSSRERIARLGEQLIQVLEDEQDHGVVLSALALATAAGCTSLAGEANGALEVVTDGFVRALRDIIARDQDVNGIIH
jgi:hypothetical protein